MTERDLSTFTEIAAIVTATRFPTSPRSVERWPIDVVKINGRRLASMAQALAHADALISAAPRIAQDGRRKPKLTAIN